MTRGQLRPSATASRIRAGATVWGLIWLLCVPIPILIVLVVLRGCT